MRRPLRAVFLYGETKRFLNTILPIGKMAALKIGFRFSRLIL